MKITFVWAVLFLLVGIAAWAQTGEAEQEVVIKEGEPIICAVMEFSGPFDAMEKNIQTYMGTFFGQGLTPGGPFMGAYYNNPREVKPEDLKWEIGFAVDKDTKVKDPLKIKEFKYQTAAVYLYIGPYEKSDQAYDKIIKHAEENGYKTLSPVLEKYLNNPREVKPEQLRTEIIIPLEKK